MNVLRVKCTGILKIIGESYERESIWPFNNLIKNLRLTIRLQSAKVTKLFSL